MRLTSTHLVFLTDHNQTVVSDGKFIKTQLPMMVDAIMVMIASTIMTMIVSTSSLAVVAASRLL